MPRPYRYHVWHRSAFDPLPAWSSRTISVKKLTGPGTETKDVYSLKKDMAQLRTDGAAKGIVDAGVVDVGTSSEGRELWALKVGKGASHKVLFTGCHHAREWISVEIPYLVAEYLIQNYTSSPTTDKEKRIHHLVENREIWFVPMTNPDGHEYTTRTDRRWRPNRKAYALPGATISAPRFGGGGPRSITYVTKVYTGVDINRNYATSTWGQETFVGPDPTTSRDPNDSGAGSIWCGPAAGSEAETQRISALIAAHGFKAGITYHNYGQLLLYPDAASGDAFVQDVGKGMNTLIAEHGNPYTYQSGSALYPTTGDLMDYSYEKVPGRPAYTPELRPKIPPAPGSWAFSGLPDSQIEPCFKENLGAALALINCAGHASAPGGCTWKLRWGFPPLVCQVVLNCWNVFKGWTP